jgi:hypothetical protein
MDATALEASSRTGPDAAIRSLANDALNVELLQTLNHLSRWLTPIHDRALLEYSPRRSQSSVKDVLLHMRDGEERSFSLMYAIASQVNPDLDRVPSVERSPLQIAADHEAAPLVVMSEFRRVRQSSASLLRSLPDNAWERDGYSRQQRNWTIRELAEALLAHDRKALGEIDRILAETGARQGIAGASRVRFEEIDRPFAVVADRTSGNR